MYRAKIFTISHIAKQILKNDIIIPKRIHDFKKRMVAISNHPQFLIKKTVYLFIAFASSSQARLSIT